MVEFEACMNGTLIRREREREREKERERYFVYATIITILHGAMIVLQRENFNLRLRKKENVR